MIVAIKDRTEDDIMTNMTRLSHIKFGSAMKQLSFLITVLLILGNCTSCIRNSTLKPPWNVNGLFISCEQEIYHRQKKYDIKEIHLLAWYRIVDKRPWHVDNALCWAEMESHNGETKWALLHMGRNPGPQYGELRNQWMSYPVFDAPSASVLFFNYPPRNKDIYEKMFWFDFKINKNWILYDYNINKKLWEKIIGEIPEKEFEN